MLMQVHDDRKKDPVVLTVEIIRCQDLSDLIHGFPADEHGPEDALLRLYVLRGNPVFHVCLLIPLLLQRP